LIHFYKRIASPTSAGAPGMGENKSVLREAVERGWVGGTSGAVAMGLQVCSLMWVRTVMNYQYRHGGTTTTAFSTLWRQGGIRRLYRGFGPALLQGPLARFGDTAANVALLSLLDGTQVPLAAQTGLASLASASWRVIIMPVDALKTTMQAEGQQAVPLLAGKVRAGGVQVLWHGAGAAYSATLVGHFPWFFTFNLLQARLPHASQAHTKLARNAAIGFMSSVVSDTVSNSLRVVKVVRQTYSDSIPYKEAVATVLKQDGWLGLFGRGLRTRILANGLQSLMFAVLWKYFQEVMGKKERS